MSARRVHPWSVRAQQAAITRMPTHVLPRRAMQCSDGTALLCSTWRSPWPRRGVSALLQTRNPCGGAGPGARVPRPLQGRASGLGVEAA